MRPPPDLPARARAHWSGAEKPTLPVRWNRLGGDLRWRHRRRYGGDAAVIPVATGRTVRAVPSAVVARPHVALIAAAVATTGVTFAMAGTGAASGMFISAIIAASSGDTKRRRARPADDCAGHADRRTPDPAACRWCCCGSSSRCRLMLTAMKEQPRQPLGNWVGRIPGSRRHRDFRQRPDPQRSLDYWWALVWIGTIGTAISIVVAWWSPLGPVDRLADVPAENSISGTRLTLRPLRRCRWSHQVSTSLTETGSAGCPELTCGLTRASSSIVGANGSGNRHRLSSPAGCRRVAACTANCHSGLQRSAAMVPVAPRIADAGSRAADDLVWGCPDDADVDGGTSFAEVGSPVSVSAETLTCRWQQQQRTAVAAALARSP